MPIAQQHAIKTQIRETLSVFVDPGSVVELRALEVSDGRGYGHTHSGYFNDLDKLTEAVLSIDGKAPAIYITLNPINPALLARAVNRLRVIKKEPLTSDQDIIRRYWLPIDIDAVRPAGISSTDEEHRAAIALSGKIRDWLTSQGWPLPVEGDSGNGAHLCYRIDLPNDEESRRLVEACLKAIAKLFNTEQAKVDPTVYNAARIWKLYGTLTKKGDSTDDRPHRRASLLRKPDKLEVVPLELLQALAESLAAKPAELPKQKPGQEEAVLEDSPEVMERARKYLAAVPGAVAGQNGDQATYKVACVLAVDFGLSEAEALPLFQEWNLKCDPSWEDRELIKKLRHAAKYGKHQLGEKRKAQPRRKRQSKRQGEEATVSCGKPVIKVEGGQLPWMVDKAEDALLQSAEKIYQRSGMLVRVLSNTQTRKWLKRAEGALIIQPVDVAYLRDVFTKVAMWIKYDARRDEWRPVDCPKDVAETYLARCIWKVPVLTGVIEAPTLRPDGSILETPGYDEETGLLFCPGSTSFSPIPQNPTKEDALKALDVFKDALRGFPFVKEVDFAVTMSANLTTLIRRSLRSAPFHGVSAHQMGTGKSLLVDFTAMIATGRTAAMMSQASSPEEEKKRLLAVLMEGDVVVCIDNVEKPLASDSLSSILTQECWKERLLGQNKTLTVPTSVTFLTTGNNLIFQGDLSTRTLLCSMDAQCEHPEERSFEVNLYKYTIERRDELVRAALTILRAYHVAGRPKQNIKPFGRFEEWSDLVRSALVWLGLPDPCESRKQVEDTDPVRVNLRALLENWYACIKQRIVTLKELVQIAQAPGNEGLLEALLGFAGDKSRNIDYRILGLNLKKLQGRIEGGLRLEQAGRRAVGILWCVRSLGK